MKTWPDWLADQRHSVTVFVAEARWPSGSPVVLPRDYEDVAQLALERALRASITATTGGARGAALRTIARRTAFDFALADMRRPSLVGDVNDEGSTIDRPDPLDDFEAMAAMDAAVLALDGLSPKMRQAVCLDALGYSTREIGDALQTSDDNVYQLQCRGRRRLALVA